MSQLCDICNKEDYTIIDSNEIKYCRSCWRLQAHREDELRKLTTVSAMSPWVGLPAHKLEKSIPIKPQEVFRESKPCIPYNMTKEELFELHAKTSEACLQVMMKKNHDYTSGGSVFSNFKDSAILGVHPVLGILIRCIDKFKRIQTYVTKGGLLVKGEGVLDAVDDVINYMILIKGIIIEEQKQNGMMNERAKGVDNE